MYKLCFYVPASHLDVVKTALFEAGAGRIGDYAACAWQCLGRGQFQALPTSQPYIGNCSELTTLEEYKVELVCSDSCLTATITALKATHPYEEPAYQYWKVNSDENT